MLTAQPLAALPPYGCGVPFTGGERLGQLRISVHPRRPHRLPNLSLRGPSGAVAISGRQLRFRRECPVIHPGPARLHPKGTSSRCALRAPRRAFALPAMTNLGAIAFLTLARTSRRCAAGRGQPGPYNVPSMAPQNAKNRGCRKIRHPRSGLTYRTVPWRGRGGRPRSGSSAAPRDPQCRWSRRRSCRRSYPHRRAPWQPRSACRASAP